MKQCVNCKQPIRSGKGREKFHWLDAERKRAAHLNCSNPISGASLSDEDIRVMITIFDKAIENSGELSNTLLFANVRRALDELIERRTQGR